MIDEERDRDLIPEELARWALLGNPYANVPSPLEDLVKRVRVAILYALKDINDL